MDSVSRSCEEQKAGALQTEHLQLSRWVQRRLIELEYLSLQGLSVNALVTPNNLSGCHLSSPYTLTLQTLFHSNSVGNCCCLNCLQD